jgi:hypothetical protein
MNITIALDVATGLVLLYLILSLLCTTLNEFVATLLKLRSKNLQATIQELIDDPSLLADFYGHGLIRSSRVASKAGTIKANQPPPPARASNFFGRIFAWIKDVWCSSHPSYLDSKDVAMALVDLLGRGAPPAPPGVAQSSRTLEEIRQAVLAKPSTYSINNVLSACVTEASGDLNKLRDGIAAWFDNAMDRLSGAYKRKIQLVTFAIALLVAVVLNADTIHVAQVLWQDPPLAAKLAQPADTWGKADLSKPDDIPTNPACQKPAQPDSDPIKKAYGLCLLNAQARAFPIGWAKSPLDREQWPWAKLLGLIMTAVALSLGAPFWFDLLGKLVNLRGTGKKPDRTKAPT